jgi:RHS repeat-associated protein
MGRQAQKKDATSGKDLLVHAPALSLPKGGGAIHGMGEKFSANPVTGTGSMSVPITTSPGRGGFGPQLALTYDSGAGNGSFGLGWSLGQPSISRKTDKGLPRYLDHEESDVFLLAGAEDLVPFIDPSTGTNKHPDTASREGKNYLIFRYRPRIEGGFALIERWVNTLDPADCCWRTISRDNITSWFGQSESSRVSDPENPARIFQWLLDETHDDKGNIVLYSYKSEDSTNVEAGLCETNRTTAQRTANRYLKRILYGNTVSRLDQSRWASNDWMFEVVFDYGDHDPTNPQPSDDEAKDTSGKLKHLWACRQDAVSGYRSGFEIRTYRLCRRVLMFHHFSELGDQPYLVKATEFSYHIASDLDAPESAGHSQISMVTHRSYELDDHGQTQSRHLPPVTFIYSQPIVSRELCRIDPAQLENLPVGTQGQGYQWADLDGEGLSGVLSEQNGAWYYKPNLGDGKFGASKVVSSKPAMAALSAGRQQLMDLSGNGEMDLVEFSGPTPGFHERTANDSWKRFVPFVSLPNIDWNDPNLRFMDLTGDGHADALITEDEIFTWYPSLDVQGFAPAEHARQATDEESGPRLVFSDSTQTIFLADMCGDGLTDLVRIRNSEVCYWPNLGYGRFGSRICLDNAPVFDHPDLYDPRRIRLADIDGSGPVDLIYLGRDGARLYFNRSGNSLSNPLTVPLPTATENLGAIQVADLLGAGTACLVWNSHLPTDAPSPVRYINLMAEGKPHLLVGTDNNLGATTEIEYTPSTRFYVQDKLAGTPWITRLPFPVHCVSRVTVRDKWRGTTFSSRYSYHHGYFDGVEREFRGFGRVEQVDVESYDAFLKGNIGSPYITDDQTLFQPPIKTITWYHTGAAIDRQRILSLFAGEYFPARYPSNFKEKVLPEPELPADLNADEWHEALRACKGMVLRQESYELDVDALHAETPENIPVRIYSAATHNCHIQCIQPRGKNKHAVFLVTESEALSYQYELPLPKTGDPATPDPRISHTMNLRHDEYGNPQQSIAVAYGRTTTGQHAGLPASDAIDIDLIDEVQAETHIAYTETRYTNDAIAGTAPVRHHRLRLPCEVRTYEITGLPKPVNFYFDIDTLCKHALSENGFYPPNGPITDQIQFYPLQYQQQPQTIGPHRRLVEHACSQYFDDSDDANGHPKTPTAALPLGQLGPRGLKYEDYKLALTTPLLQGILGDRFNSATEVALNTSVHSGYWSGSNLFGTAGAQQWWMRSGTAGFAPDASLHFYLPEEYTDPFGNKTTLALDGKYDLFIQSSRDAKNNSSHIANFDYRILAPSEMVDANGNHTEVAFDVHGMPVAAAIKGKQLAAGQWEGDDLSDFNFAQRNLSSQAIQQFCADSTMNEATARSWLGRATTRFVYHFGDLNGQWNQHMAGTCSITREQHKSADSPLQVSLECSDGSGNVLMKKVQAEPEPGNTGLRWIINGLTVLNNKGKPIKQYEPTFSEQGFGCEMPPQNGVTAILYYDAAGRSIRTEMPDCTFSRVEFSPWHVKTFDANDTVLESDWYKARTGTTAGAEESRAATLAAKHADTPAITLLDSLGRSVISIAHNRAPDPNGVWQDDFFATFTKLDAEGKPLWIRDARGHLVMQYITPYKGNNDASNAIPANAAPCYDIAGNLLFQHSMDAGDCWTINDAAGKPMFAWDKNQRQDDSNAMILEDRRYSTEYDALHRPISLKLSIDGGVPVTIEKFEYQDAQTDPVNNLNGQLIRHYDASGLTETIRLDFNGSPLEVRRTLVKDATSTVTDWQDASQNWLSSETFTQITEYDALKRMTRLFNWHHGDGSRVAVYKPEYGERGILKRETLIVGATKDNSAEGYSGGQETNAILEIWHDAKGQRETLKLGNGVTTNYTYDPDTYRLVNLRSTRSISEPCSSGRSSMFVDDHNVQDLRYWYDPVGNITEITDLAFNTMFFSGQKIEAVNRYEYDALYRLINATGRENGAASGAPTISEDTPLTSDFPCVRDDTFRNYTQRYIYDAVGNIRQMKHEAGPLGSWVRNYAYAFEDPTQPASNRLWQTWSGDDRTQATTYHYDTHGSMLNLANVPDDFHMRWDHRDMIASINLGGGGFAHHQYDASKQRTRKTIAKNNGNITEERIYLGGLERYRRTENGTLKEEIETLHLFDGEQRLLMVDQILETDRPELGKRTLYRYTLSNHLGSSMLELDDQAKLISVEEYHPYGTSAYRAGRKTAEVKLKRYRYTGMEQDEESGLSYHTARYYTSWLGRWSSSDQNKKDLTSNRYQYCSSNPTSRIDTNGLSDTEWWRVFFRQGEIGELMFDQFLDQRGGSKYFNFIDWDKQIFEPGFDRVVYKHGKDGLDEVWFVDNKAYSREINQVSAFENRFKNFFDSAEAIDKYGDMAKKARIAMKEGRYKFVVSNANSMVDVAMSKKLFDRGYHVLDLRTGRLHSTAASLEKSLSSGARNSRYFRTATKAAAIGSGLTAKIAGAAKAMGFLAQVADVAGPLMEVYQAGQDLQNMLDKGEAILQKLAVSQLQLMNSQSGGSLAFVENAPIALDQKSGGVFAIETYTYRDAKDNLQVGTSLVPVEHFKQWGNSPIYFYHDFNAGQIHTIIKEPSGSWSLHSISDQDPYAPAFAK